MDVLKEKGLVLAETMASKPVGIAINRCHKSFHASARLAANWIKSDALFISAFFYRRHPFNA